MEGDKSYTVLRIKRKATEPPLSSLVIQDPSASGSGFGTPKKRRDVSGRPKGVFRLADTVPDSWVGKGKEGEVLKERIRGLMGDGTAAQRGSASKGADTLGDGLAGPASQQGGAVLEPQGGSDRVGSRNRDAAVQEKGDAVDNKGKAAAISSATNAFGLPPKPSDHPSGPSTISVSTTATKPPLRPSTPTKRSSVSTGLQYRVVPPPSATRRPNGLPPRVVPYAEIEAQAKAMFRFVDARAVDSDSTSRIADARTAGTRRDDTLPDPSMAAFEDMLQEYLKVEASAAEAAAAQDEEQYVFDLYYRDTSDTSASLLLGAGDGVGPQSVGALLDFDLLSPPSSPSSSEPEDEADEDSNDEDFYRNDYPEDEDADEDMEEFEDAFGSDSADEQSEEGSDEGGGRGAGGGGGKWDYR